MIRHRGGAIRRDEEHELRVPTSAAEIGGMLRRARESRGLDLLTVHDRLERPITQLEAIEAGDLDGMPDQALALSTLRRYAAFLALDSDALTLQMIEAWSQAPSTHSRRSGRGNGHRPPNGVVTGVSSAPDHLRAFTQTGQVPSVAGAGTSATAADGSEGHRNGIGVGPPTGTLSVVPREEIKETRRATKRVRRQRQAPMPLRAATWLTVALLLVVVVGAGIQHWRPHLFTQWHLVHVTPTVGGSRLSSSPAPGSHPTRVTAPPVVQAATTAGGNGTTATYTVSAQHFAVGVATSGPCWVQVTDTATVTPLYRGVLVGGEHRSFDVTSGSLSVEVGASAVTLGVSINGKIVFLAKPTRTPFTYVFSGRPAT